MSNFFDKLVNLNKDYTPIDALMECTEDYAPINEESASERMLKYNFTFKITNFVSIY